LPEQWTAATVASSAFQAVILGVVFLLWWYLQNWPLMRAFWTEEKSPEQANPAPAAAVGPPG